ncbi:hypothetical protein BU16DRAFT_51296 [Lophium mytilinum]|uniref:Uncharacterized protein n=1 Tax=Lophium mytilinum TaxID=390894 RepID=A0A6A6QS44_9PEZI|nr:hypothetical protein BU16DRAFT_51296 [Lophium mytilinum]
MGHPPATRRELPPKVPNHPPLQTKVRAKCHTEGLHYSRHPDLPQGTGLLNSTPAAHLQPPPEQAEGLFGSFSGAEVGGGAALSGQLDPGLQSDPIHRRRRPKVPAADSTRRHGSGDDGGGRGREGGEAGDVEVVEVVLASCRGCGACLLLLLLGAGLERSVTPTVI